MNLVQGMYENVRRCVRVGEGLSDEFEGKVGVHQGCSVHSSSMSCLMLCHSKWGKVPADCLFKETSDALDRGNYRRLKLTEQAMKVIQRIAYSLVRQVMTFDWGTLGGPLCRWHSY